MKKLIILLVVIGAGYYFYIYSADPSEITNPYYAEARVKLKVHSRELTMVLMGEMSDIADCEKRGQRFWSKTLEACETCVFVDYQCKTELSKRYQILFENRPTYTTYVVAERGTRFERDARMIVWGLSKAESTEFCNYLVKTMKKKYKGQVSCIEGFSS